MENKTAGAGTVSTPAHTRIEPPKSSSVIPSSNGSIRNGGIGVIFTPRASRSAPKPKPV